MAFKPFKPPALKSSSLNTSQERTSPSYAPVKRRKLSPAAETQVIAIDRQPTRPREPLRIIANVPSPENTVISTLNEGKYFSVLWRKFSTKKNKTWDDDGVICWSNGAITLYDSKGHLVGTTVHKDLPTLDTCFSLNGREVQIEASISLDEFEGAIGRVHKKCKQDVKSSSTPAQSGGRASVTPKSISVSKHNDQHQVRTDTIRSASNPIAKPSSNHVSSGRAAFKQPLKDNNVLPQIPSEIPVPRHDPEAPGALVFKRPKRVAPGQQIVDIVLDPILSKHLRDHQREGIRFLYECVMDMRDFGGQGCILADDMGLGKTLQTIALLWTLVKQNPVYRAEPVIKKALIVCPVTLVENWKKEFRKWLGRDRLGYMAFGDRGSSLSMFNGKNFKVMIVGYERLRTIAEDLTKGAGIDIIICDEGHRLKTLQNKSAKAIETLNTPRRIILSGTPIQNDLSEFFAMANFVNDGVLGTYKGFLRDFEKPIMKSRQPNATKEDIERGEEASHELASITSPFILRRTAEILSNYLPSRTEYVLFCNPTPEQASVYRQVLQTPMFQNALGSNEAALQMITILKKLCNSPSLLKPKTGNDLPSGPNSMQALYEMLPPGISRYFQNSFSSKIRLLDELLHKIRTTTDDKVVLVSHYTSTLNLMENLLLSSGMSYRRLDGSLAHAKRQPLVEEFNRSSATACFAFLLSAKAGGVGINLVGGNRLILFDVDWNPATDDQAMARIHREGQRKPCKIYRFLIKGGLEERIWQRQVVKRGLADTILDSGPGNNVSNLGKSKTQKAAFSREELRDLFRLDERQSLQTHDLIQCACSGKVQLASVAPPNGDIHTPISSKFDDCEVISDSEDDLPDVTSIVRASQLTDEEMQRQERTISTGKHPKQAHSTKKQESQIQELMTYTHINTTGFTALGDDEEVDHMNLAIDDDCLMHVLRQEKDVISGNIAYVFLKRSKPGKTEDPMQAALDENE